METTESSNTTVPINDSTIENKVDIQNVEPTPEVKPETVQTEIPGTQSNSEVKQQPTTVVTNNDDDDDSIKDNIVKVNGKTITIDAQPYVSELFNKNPGEIAEVFNMDPKHLKREQDKLKKKGLVMDNKYANLFLLQSLRDECGILVMGCLASWFLTRIGFSIYWTFLVMVATLMSYITYNNRKKHLYYNKERKAYNQKIKLNPENPETLNWLNYILRKAWPTAEPLICNIVMDSVNGILDDILNNPIISKVLIAVDSIKISEFSLGTEAPMLMEMCPITDSDSNVIKFTSIAKYEPLDTNKISKYDIESGEKRASNIVLSVKPKIVPSSIPTQVNDILFVGKLLFVITTMEAFPYVKKVEFTFIEQPNVKWTLKPLSAGIDIMKLGLDAGIDAIIKNVISSIALEPTRITIDVEDLLKSMTLDQPIGLLKLNFYEGKELKNTSKMGTDDPYGKFSVNGIELSRTKVIDNDLNPVWNHTEYAIVSGVIYSDPKNNSDLALIEVLSGNSLKKDNVIGRAENFYLRQYIALCEILRKKKLDEERDAAFIENLNKQGIYDEQEIARIKKEERKKRKKELALKEKNKSFAQKLLSSLEVSAEDYINGLTDVERKEYINQWGNPLVDSDTIIPLYELGKDGNIDKTKPAGTVRMGINYIPLNQFNENLEETTEIFSETGIARIWIYKVQKLEGSPNPYCVAEIDGVEVVTTSKKKYNNNPGFNCFKDVFIKNFSTAKLSIAVKDSKTGTDEVLGTFEWSIYEIYERLKEDPGANWFKLSSKFDEAVINLGLEWKPLIINMSSNLLKPVGICRLHVKGAKNLKNSEKFGISDPYVKINLSGKEVGVTDVVDNDLNPEFREVYYLMIRSKNDRLSFEVFDFSEMKNDSKLGKVEMNITDICRNIVFNGEQCPLSKAWENMNPLPEIKKTTNNNTFVSVPLFDNQVASKISQGRIEFDLNYYGIADIGLKSEEEDTENKKENVNEDILASENTDRTFINKLQESTLISGIIRVKIHSISDLPKEAFYNVETYFEDEPFNALLKTSRSSKPSKEGNIEETVEGFVRNYLNTKMVFAINENNGVNVNRLASLVIPVQNLLIGKLNLEKPCIHICDNGFTKIKLGVEYEPINIRLERGEISPQMGVINVLIDKANVIGKDSSGTSDPYVKVLLRGQEIYKTDTVKKTLTPVWNERFKVNISDRISNKLVFQVFDWNKVQKHDLIGQADVPLYEVYDGEKINITLPLVAYDKGGNKIENGNISLEIEFTPQIHNNRIHSRISNNTNAARKLAGGVGTFTGGVVGGVGTVVGGVGTVAGGVAGGVASGVGSIARGIGLKKSPKSTVGSTNIKIKIIKAENLKAVDNSGTSDPYVKVQHQKKTLYKTKSIKKNLCPVWSEECSFAFDKETSDPIVSFIIKDSNKFGKSVDLGNVELNINDVLFNANQTSIEKAFDVQNGPGKLYLQIDYVENGDAADLSQAIAETP